MESSWGDWVESLLSLPDTAYAYVTAQAAARRAQRPTDETDEAARPTQRRRGNNDDGEPMEADEAPEEGDNAMAVEPPSLAAPVQGATAGAIVPAQAVEGSGEGAAPQKRSYAETLKREQVSFAVELAHSQYCCVFLDFEMTGLNKYHDEPIQIALRVPATGQKRVWYVLPNVPISAGAYEIHRMDEIHLELMNAAPIEDVLPEVVEWLTEVSGERQLAFAQHGRLDVAMLDACLQRYRIDSSLLDDAPVLDTLACAKTILGHTDLINDGFSLKKLHYMITGQELKNAHDADVDVVATIGLAARQFACTPFDSADAFFEEHARRYSVQVGLEPAEVVEDDDDEVWGLVERLGEEGLQALAEMRRAGRAPTLDELYTLAFTVPTNRSYEHSDARQRLLAALEARRSGGGDREPEDHEPERPHGATALAQPGFYFNPPDDRGSDDDCAAAWELAYADFERRHHWSLRATECRLLDFRNPEHRHVRRVWYRKWSGLEGGTGRRPWVLGSVCEWNHMVKVMGDVEGAEFARWLNAFDVDCWRRAGASFVGPKPRDCEHCASLRAAVDFARRGRRGAPTATSMFRGERYVRFETGGGGATAIRGADLIADHIKGTPILRCWTCTRCNVQLTNTYDSAPDVRETLSHAAYASEASYDHIGVTRAGPG